MGEAEDASKKKSRTRGRSPLRSTVPDTPSQSQAENASQSRPEQETKAPATAGMRNTCQSLPSNPTEAMSQNWTKKDFEGNGVCMYRAVAGTRAWVKDGRTLTPDEARTGAAELRMAVVQHARKHARTRLWGNSWTKIWSSHPDITWRMVPKSIIAKKHKVSGRDIAWLLNLPMIWQVLDEEKSQFPSSSKVDITLVCCHQKKREHPSHGCTRPRRTKRPSS